MLKRVILEYKAFLTNIKRERYVLLLSYEMASQYLVQSLPNFENIFTKYVDLFLASVQEKGINIRNIEF